MDLKLMMMIIIIIENMKKLYTFEENISRSETEFNILKCS